MINATITHPDYRKYQHRWRTMRAVLEGEDALKGTTGEYSPSEFLPGFDPADDIRYKKYVQRAVFTNFTAWTQEGLTGSAFRRPMVTELPETLEYLITNIDGTGHGIEQYAKELVGEILAVGRFGILVDAPDVTGSVPHLWSYRAETILDWAVMIVGGQLRLSRVDLLEDGGKIRRLSIDNGIYYQQELDLELKPLGPPKTPLRANGTSLNYIPFQIVGSKDNRPDIDKPPLLDIAHVNLGHWRNSADREENLFVHGQGTTFVSSEMSFEQFSEANPDGIVMGALRGHFIGANGTATLLQTAPSSALKEGMDDKVVDMIGLGARFIQERGGGQQQTAEAARINAAQSSSGLSTVVGNCEDGLVNGLKFVADFLGANPDDIKVQLNRDFFDKGLSAQEISAMIMLQDSEVMARYDLRALLRRAGVIDRTDEEIDDDISMAKNGG